MSTASELSTSGPAALPTPTEAQILESVTTPTPEPTEALQPTQTPNPEPTAAPTPQPTPTSEPTETPQPTQTPTAEPTEAPAADEPDWWNLAYPVIGCGATFEETQDPTFSLRGGAVSPGLFASVDSGTVVLVRDVTFNDIDGDLIDEVFVEIDCRGSRIDSAHWEIVLVLGLDEGQTTHVVRHFISGNEATVRAGQDGEPPSIDTWSHRSGDLYRHGHWTFDDAGDLVVVDTVVSVDEMQLALSDALPILGPDSIAGVPFGTEKETALASLTEVLGPPTSTSDGNKCGGSPGTHDFAAWHGELTVLFYDGALDGWAYSTRQWGLSPDWMALNNYSAPQDPMASPMLSLATTEGIGLLTTVEDLADLSISQQTYPGSLDPSYWPWVASWELEDASEQPSIVGVLDRTGGRTVGLSVGYTCGERWHPLPP